MVCLMASCGRSEPIHPVQGQVVWNGQPLADAMVVFHPLDEARGGSPKPLAQTDSGGWFQLTTLRQGDGARAGEYAVTVERRERVIVGEEMVRHGRNQLPERYSRPETSGLRCRVQPGLNELPAFQLTPD